MNWTFDHVDFRVILLLICTQLENNVRYSFQNLLPTSYEKWILFQASWTVIANRTVFQPAIRVSRIPDFSPNVHTSCSLADCTAYQWYSIDCQFCAHLQYCFKSLTRRPNQHLFLLCLCVAVILFTMFFFTHKKTLRSSNTTGNL